MPASEADLMRRLDELGIATTTVRHPPVFTVEEARAHRGAIPGGHCKSLFLKDKAGALFLVVLLEDARLDMKSLQPKLGSGRLSFSSADLMRAVLGVEPGSVTPFAVINESARPVQVVLDEAMMRHAELNYHPLTNSATTTIASADLVKFLRAHGHEPRILAL
jgi:Ala-tRNA(Pro) deacylase